MKIAIGTPPTPLLVSIDSTSNILWIPYQECSSSCAETKTTFNSMASSTYKNTPCTNSQQLCSNSCHSSSNNDVCLYNKCTKHDQEHCPTGTIATETITLTSSTTGQSILVPEFPFVCGNNIGRNFAGAGIAGLGQGPISLTSRLYNVIDGKFSYCLAPYNSDKSSKITFGDLNFDDPSSSEVFSMPLGQDKNTGKYYLPIFSIETEGQEAWKHPPPRSPPQRVPLIPLHIPPRIARASGYSKEHYLNSNISNAMFTALIDTETLFTRIPKSLFHYFAVYVSYDITNDPTVQLFDKGLKLKFCYRYTAEEFKPKKITMQFYAGDIDLRRGINDGLMRSIELGISNSFIRVSENVTCLAFEENDDDTYVLGSWQMMNYKYGFDLKKETAYIQKTDCTN